MRGFSLAAGALLAGLLCLVLLGCAGRQGQADTALALRLSPEAYQGPEEIHQQLHVARGDRVQRLEAVLRVDSQQVSLAALAPGHRLFSLTWDGVQMQMERSPTAPAPEQLDPLRILDDIQLAFWPASIVASAMPEGCRLQHGHSDRRVYCQERLLAEVLYDAEHDWPYHRIELINHRFGYRLTIQSSPLK